MSRLQSRSMAAMRSSWRSVGRRGSVEGSGEEEVLSAECRVPSEGPMAIPAPGQEGLEASMARVKGTGEGMGVV